MRARDKNGRGRGLAMLRLETQRYEQEVQHIRRTHEHHLQRKSTQYFQTAPPKSSFSVFSSGNGVQDESWRFPETIKSSQITTSNPQISYAEKSITESHSEVSAHIKEETPKVIDEVLGNSRTQPDRVRIEAEQTQTVIGCTTAKAREEFPRGTCNKHCHELKIKESSSGGNVCECHANEPVRVNARMVFTANPGRVPVQKQKEIRIRTLPRAVQREDGSPLTSLLYETSFKTETDSQKNMLHTEKCPMTSMAATTCLKAENVGQNTSLLDSEEGVSVTSIVATKGLLETYNLDGLKSRVVIQKLEELRHNPSGLRALATPLPQQVVTCLSARSHQEDGGSLPSYVGRADDLLSAKESRRLTSNVELRPASDLHTAAPVASVFAQAGYHEGPEVAQYSSAEKEETSYKRIRKDTSEGAVAARLATKIKQALEGITSKASPQTVLPKRPSRGNPIRRPMSLNEFPELHHVEGSGVGKSDVGRKVAGADSLPKIIWHMPKTTNARSLEHHSQGLPGLDADLYLQDVMAALSTFQPQAANVPPPRINSPDETTSSFSIDDAAIEEGKVPNGLSGVTADTSLGAEGPGSELGGHACGQSHRLKAPAKAKWEWTNREFRKNQKLLMSSVEKFCNAAESAKRLYGDLVHCADQELKKSTDSHDGEHLSREDVNVVPVEVTHITRNGCGHSSKRDKTTDDGVRTDVQPSGCTGTVEHSHPSPSRFIAERRAPCTACLPFDRIDCAGMEQPAEPSKTAIDEVTIDFSDDIDGEATVNVVHNGDPDQPGYNIEIITPFESPRQENSQPDQVLRKGTATWKDGHKPIGKRVTGKLTKNYKSASKNRHVVVRGSSVYGGRDQKSPLKSRGNTRPEWNYSAKRLHEVPDNICEEIPCSGLSNEGRDHKSPFKAGKVIPRENTFEEGREEKSSKNLFDELPGHGLLSNRKAHKTPLKTCSGKVSEDVIREQGLFKDERGHRCPLSAPEDILQDIPTSRRSDLRSPMDTRTRIMRGVSSRNDHHGIMQSRNRLPHQGLNLKGGEAGADQLPESEVIQGEPSHSAGGTGQFPTRWTGNTSTSREAKSQTTPMAQPENVDRAAAAAGLAKEIEVMITHGAPKRVGNMKSRQIKPSPRQIFPQEEQGEPYRHTKLDRAVVAAVQAVNKLKTIHSVSSLSHHEGHPKPAPQKRRPHPAKEFHKDTAGDGFYDQMHQELKELASERMKLVRQERARCQTQFSLISHRQGDDRDARKPHRNAMTTSDLRNLVGDGDDSSILVRKDMQSPASISGAWTSSYTPGAKRQRSTISPAREHKLLRLSAGNSLQLQSSPRSYDHKFSSSLFSQAAGSNILGPDTFHGGKSERMESTVAGRKDKYVPGPSAHNNVSSSDLFGEAGSSVLELDTFHGRKSAIMESTFGRKMGKHMAGDEVRKDHVEARMRGSAVPTTAALKYGKWKTPPSQQHARVKSNNVDSTASRKKVFSKRKFRIPAWVDRMSHTTDVISSFLPLPHLSTPSEEYQGKPSVRRRSLRPPPSTFMALWSAKMSEHMRKSRAISMSYFSPARAPRTSCEYDVATGRRIYPGQEPPIKMEKRLSDHKSKYRTGSSCERIFGPRRHPITKRELKPRDAGGECKNYSMRPRGWNSDPWVLSGIPHKSSDIIRENKNAFKSKGKTRRRIAGRGDITLPGNPKEVNLPHVTFAAMESQSKEKSGTGAPKQPALPPLVRTTRLIASPRTVRAATGSGRNGLQKIGCSVKNREDRGIETEKNWAFTEEFWTKILKAELEEAERHEAVHILATNSGRTAEPGSPTLQTGSACMRCEDNVHADIDHIQEEDVLRGDSLLPFISSDNQKVLDFESGVPEEVGEWIDATPSLDIAVPSEGNMGFQSARYSDGEDKLSSHRLGPVKTPAASVSGSGNDEDEITLQTTTIVESVHLLYQSKDAKPESTAQIFQEGFIAESTSLNDVGDEDISDDEIQLLEEDSGSFPRSSLLQLEVLAPTGLDYEGFPNKYDIVQQSSLQIEAQMEEPGSSSLRSTRQDFLNTIHAHVEEEGMQLEDVDLERTLMDIVLHTILRDDPLQDLQTRNSSQRQSLTSNSRVEKEVEAWISPVDVIQSPPPKAAPKVDRVPEPDNICCSLEKECQTLERDFPPQSIREPHLQQQGTSEAQHTQMHQATQSPWHCVEIQTADVTTPGSSTPLGPPSALPMLVPFYFAPYAPTLTPSIHFASPLHTVIYPMELSLCPPPVTASNQSTQAVSTQSILNSSHSHLPSHENTATIVSRPPELPSRPRSAQKHVESSEDDSESEWEEMKRFSSPPTPTTPVSSPDHKAKLKRAMEPYPGLINTGKCTPQITPNVKVHCSETNSEVSQPATEIGRQTENFDYKKRPVFNLSTTATMEERSDDRAGPPLRPEGNQTSSLGTSGGRSWARVKEMEEAALSLLRTVLRKTPCASSSSEYSGDTSPRLRGTLSPGELNSRGVGRSSNSCESTELCVAIGNGGRRMNRLRSHALGLIGSDRASIGEISNLLHMFGAPSEGEVEAGALPSMDEVGQISHGTCSINTVQSAGSEPGELHAEADSTSEARVLKSIRSVCKMQACAGSSFSEGEVRPLQYLNYKRPVRNCSSSSSSMHKKEEDNNSQNPEKQP